MTVGQGDVLFPTNICGFIPNIYIYTFSASHLHSSLKHLQHGAFNIFTLQNFSFFSLQLLSQQPVTCESHHCQILLCSTPVNQSHARITPVASPPQQANVVVEADGPDIF